MIKSERYTSKYLNKNKLNKLIEIDTCVKILKNNISKFIKEHIFELKEKGIYEFSKYYKLFKIEQLDAWETQQIFLDISKNYLESFDSKSRNLKFLIQKNIKYTFYKRNTEKYNIGDLKEFKLEFNKISNLGKLIKYLTFCNLNNLKNFNLNTQIQDLLEYYNLKGLKNRILNLVKLVQYRLNKNLKVIEYTTGTYRVAYNHSSYKNKEGKLIQYNGFIKDDTNTKYKHWFKLKDMYIPIQINDTYHNFELIKNSQYFIKVNKNKVDFIGNKEVDDPVFKESNKVEGLDLNVKNNFGVLSNNKLFDYDRKYIKDFIDQLKKLDQIGLKNISDQQKKHLNKLVKRNEWYFKKLISEILDYCEDENITDLVLEDLSKFNKTFIKSDEFDIKYSRLVRLLRLSNIKVWMNSQAEKRGIKVHLTQSHYSSQQCSTCGCIDIENRQSQEKFECINCGFKSNADLNASLNLKDRFVLNVLKQSLHSKDNFNRLLPKVLNKDKIKNILESVKLNNEDFGLSSLSSTKIINQNVSKRQ